MRVIRSTPAECSEIRFGRFRLDLRRRTLLRDGRPVRLGGRRLDLLCALASAGGDVLTKDELMARLWPGQLVEEGNLYVHISALRRALADGDTGYSYVVTVPGRGYRLAGLGGYELAGLEEPVQTPDPPAPAQQGPSPSDIAAHPVPGRSLGLQALEGRQLTVIACEIVGAARLATLLEPEALRTAMTDFYRCCTETVGSFGGSMTWLVGSQMLAYFGYPQAREHAAEKAVRAALALVDKVGNLAAAHEPLKLRLGIATGFVIVGNLVDTGVSEPTALIGESLNVAAFLRKVAEPSAVVIAASTSRLLGNLFEVRKISGLQLEGYGPVEACEVVGADTIDNRFAALHGSVLTPFVGREEEIESLLRQWQRAKAAEMRVVLISGEPGIGKSRLCAEFWKQIRDEPHTCLRFFCSPHYQDSALYPVIRQFEFAAGFDRRDTAQSKLSKLGMLLRGSTEIADRDLSLLAEMLSLPLAGGSSVVELSSRRKRELTFDVLIRQLEATAIGQPLLMIFEDVHWCDPTTLELLELFIRKAARRNILLLITFRPEFEAPWAGQARATTMTISRLDDRDGAALVRHVLGRKVLSDDLILEIADRADGIPLFLEELSKAFVELEVGAPPGIPSDPQTKIPMTLQASLMARLDRLPHGKQVAQIGAVIGRVFTHALLAEVSNVPEAQLAQGMRELISAGLVNMRGFPPEATYMFKHVLIQDTAYESLLRSRRAEIHAAVVDTCERVPYFNIEPGVLAHHCAQAGLIAKAAFYYRKAAEHSIEQAAITETRMQLQRGLAFAANLPECLERDELEAELLLALAIVLQTTDSMSNAEAARLFSRATDVSRNSGRPQLLSRALWGQFTSVLVRGEVPAARALAEELLNLSQASDEVDMQIAARSAMGIALYYQGHFDGAREHLTIHKAILGSQLERADLDWRTTTAGPAFLALTLACLGYPEQAANQLNRAIESANRKGSFALAYSLSIAVRVLIVLRNEEGLREHAVRLVALSEEGGFDQFRNQGLSAVGWLEARTSAGQQGFDRLRDALTGMLDQAVLVGLPFYRSLLVDAQSENQCRQDNIAALDEALDLSERIGDAWFTAELHRKRGEVLAGLSSDPMPAETELHRALAIAREQAAKLFELRAATSLARLLRDHCRSPEAVGVLHPVYDRFTEGFDTADLRTAKALLDELA